MPAPIKQEPGASQPPFHKKIEVVIPGPPGTGDLPRVLQSQAAPHALKEPVSKTQPEDDPDAAPKASALKWQLEVLAADAARVWKEDRPNNPERVVAACRLLNDCTKRGDAVRLLLSGQIGERRARDEFRGALRRALEMARGMLRGDAPGCDQLLLCQVCNGIRGVLACWEHAAGIWSWDALKGLTLQVLQSLQGPKAFECPARPNPHGK